MNQPNLAPQPKKSNVLKIVLIVLGVLFLGSIATCATCAYVFTPDKVELTEKADALATTRKDYVGDWTGPGTTLSVAPTGSIAWKKGGTSYSGETGFHNDDLVVLVMSVTFPLKVTKKPTKEGAVWKMTIEGVDVTRPAT